MTSRPRQWRRSSPARHRGGFGAWVRRVYHSRTPPRVAVPVYTDPGASRGHPADFRNGPRRRRGREDRRAAHRREGADVGPEDDQVAQDQGSRPVRLVRHDHPVLTALAGHRRRVHAVSEVASGVAGRHPGPGLLPRSGRPGPVRRGWGRPSQRAVSHPRPAGVVRELVLGLIARRGRRDGRRSTTATA